MEASKIKLSYRDRDKLFKKYFTELKIKVALNWFELLALLTVSLFTSYKLLAYSGSNRATSIVMSVIISIVITCLFCYIRKYKLTINRFDKEHIYKRLSNELIEESKP